VKKVSSQPKNIIECTLLGNTLSDSPINKRMIVSHIDAGYNATKRLSELGILPGTEIVVLTYAPFKGPLQIEVRGTRLALGRGLSEKIYVKEC
jgi:Fe2+ transport system protein FeoA